MKRFLTIVLLLFVVSLLKTSAYAAGQPCCDANHHLSGADQCQNNFDLNTYINIACDTAAGETCHDNGVLDTSGICLAAESEVTGECCSADGYFYNPITKLCQSATDPGQPPQCSGGDICYSGSCISNIDAPAGSVEIQKVCDSILDSAERGNCQSCMDNGDAWTVFGCITTSTGPGSFVNGLLTFGVGLAGGIAFLLILLGGFQIMTGGGNPEQLNAGKELVGSAITGLLLIIFSVFVLRVIGVNILGLPGFN